jgi:hypothetical protein
MAAALTVSTAASLPGVPSNARSVALVAAVLIAGCGGGDSPKPVSISLVSPADGVVVHEDGVELRGRVRPAGARVLVGGRVATVVDGEFRGRVPLQEGANVIDVAASAPDARTAWSAVRVERETLVAVPDLAGTARDDAVDRLEALGLRAEVEEGGGLLDRLLPGDFRVCETRPSAGAELRRGATVRVGVSKSC